MEEAYGQEISLFGRDDRDISERGEEGERGRPGRTAPGVAGDAQRGEAAPGKEADPGAGKAEEPLYVENTFLKEPSKSDKVSFKQADLPFGQPAAEGKAPAVPGEEVPGSPRSVVMRTTGRIDAEGNNVSSPADAAALLSFLKNFQQHNFSD